MQGPIISIDVSNGTSHFQAFLNADKKVGKVHKIKHDVEGFKFLLSKINELKEQEQQDVSVVYEATGVYTKPVQRFLEKNNIKQFRISPLQSARKRKEELHGKKTDKLDPKYIAKVYYGLTEMYEYHEEEPIYHKMRLLNRIYEDRMEHLRKFKVSFQERLSIVFPGYLDLFKDGYTDTSLTILKYYPHPDLLKNKHPETVAKKIEKHCNHSYKVCLSYASKVIDYANVTYPGCDKDDINIRFMLDLLEKIVETRKELDSYLNELISLAETLPNYRIILSIDGIGPNLASRIIAEIGDIKRFESREALIAYAGTDPIISESGNIDGRHLSITKKGNKRLRCLLYLAVTCNIRSKKENPIKTFYVKKKQQSTPLKSKAAKIACVTKLIRTIFGMCNNGTTFL